MIYCGIDPGLDGALAFLYGDSHAVVDMPVVKVGKKRDYEPVSLVEILENRRWETLFVVIEGLHAMPKGICGGVTNFSLGRASGMFEGIFSALKISYQKVPPQRWKKTLLDGMPKEKGSSIIVARRLFPTAELNLKKHHGRADALLLAEYAKRIQENY